MKKFLFFATALFMFISFQSYAQQQQRGPREKMTPEQQAERYVEYLNKEVKLTEEQQKELKTWFIASFKKRAEEFQKNREGGREAMIAQMKKNHEETEAQLKKVLTEEQYKIHVENSKKMMQQRQQGPRRPQGAHPGGNRGGGFPRN